MCGVAGGSGGGAVASVFGRIGAVVAQAGDYAASQVSNDSGVAGADVAAALDALDAEIAAVAADVAALDSSDIANASSVAGATVTAALDALHAGRLLEYTLAFTFADINVLPGNSVRLTVPGGPPAAGSIVHATTLFLDPTFDGLGATLTAGVGQDLNDYYYTPTVYDLVGPPDYTHVTAFKSVLANDFTVVLETDGLLADFIDGSCIIRIYCQQCSAP